MQSLSGLNDEKEVACNVQDKKTGLKGELSEYSANYLQKRVLNHALSAAFRRSP